MNEMTWGQKWHVRSSSGHGSYIVSLADDGKTYGCSCIGWTRHTPRVDCKHIRAVKEGDKSMILGKEFKNEEYKPDDLDLLLDRIILGEASEPDAWIESQLDAGAKVEKEHTDNEEEARKIAQDHLKESKYYYLVLNVVEPYIKKMNNMGQSEAEGVAKKLDEVLQSIVEGDSEDAE